MNIFILVACVLTIVIQTTVFISMLLTYNSWVLVYNMKWRGFMTAVDMAAAGFFFFSLSYIIEFFISSQVLITALVLISCALITAAAIKSFFNIKDLVIASD